MCVCSSHGAMLTLTKSRSFKSQHQVIGFLVVAGLLVQPVLGFLHHRRYVRTGQKGLLSSAHRIVGYLAIFFGIMNGFLWVDPFVSRSYSVNTNTPPSQRFFLGAKFPRRPNLRRHHSHWRTQCSELPHLCVCALAPTPKETHNRRRSGAAVVAAQRVPRVGIEMQ